MLPMMRKGSCSVSDIRLPGGYVYCCPSKQCLFVFCKQLVIYFIQVHMVDDAKADDGVPFDLRIDLRIGNLLEQRLNFIQCAAQPDTDAEKPVSGGVSPAGKNLVKVYFTDTGPPCKLGFGNRLFFVELCQELRHILLRKREDALLLRYKSMLARLINSLVNSPVVLSFIGFTTLYFR